MPRRLYLLRHAQSAERQHGQTDFDRGLTPFGMQQATRVARFFLEQKSFPEIIHSSAAQRARTTAGLIAEQLRLRESDFMCHDVVYEASTRSLLEFVSGIDDNYQHVMCVGHNPAISYLAEYLTKAEIGEMVPAGMAIIELNIDSWKEAGKESAELLRYLEANV